MLYKHEYSAVTNWVSLSNKKKERKKTQVSVFNLSNTSQKRYQIKGYALDVTMSCVSTLSVRLFSKVDLFVVTLRLFILENIFW